MKLRVRLFAWMAQEAGWGEKVLEVREGETLHGIATALREKSGVTRWPTGVMWAVNQEYAGEERVLQEGDEIAVIPPVSGG